MEDSLERWGSFHHITESPVQGKKVRLTDNGHQEELYRGSREGATKRVQGCHHNLG